jgi:NAD-dependent SIR2 family protein deacetylase
MRPRVLFVLAVLSVLPGREARAEESCATCHPNVKTEAVEGVHAKDLSCTDCHGGDPTVVTMESHSVAAGYIGKPSRVDIPALCARCHADPNRMKPFGLATDQYAQYQTSGHGVRLAQGDTKTAVCTDCHGTHRMLPPREPTSPTARRNIPETCGRCHSDQALMGAYKMPADQVEKFRHSVHGIALFDEEHPSAPTCATCHGAHGAIALHVGSISMVCGHCHSRTREYFNEGPHRKAADEGKMSECVSCHGYHDIAHPDRTLFDTTCPSCHPPDSPNFATAQKLKTLLSRADEAVETCAADMTRIARLFPTVAHYYPRLQQAKAHFMEALPVQHSLAVDRVDDLTRSARSIAEDVRASVHGVEQEGQLRYVVLGGAWVFILFTAGVAYLYKKERARASIQQEGAERD